MPLKSDWRGNRPLTTVGGAEKIRAAIRRARKPLSFGKLKIETGLSAVQLRSAIAGMMVGSGGLVSRRTPAGVVYDIYRAESRDEARPGVAGRITIPQFRWGASRLSW
jgi:hypothetical protein